MKLYQLQPTLLTTFNQLHGSFTHETQNYEPSNTTAILTAVNNDVSPIGCRKNHKKEVILQQVIPFMPKIQSNQP